MPPENTSPLLGLRTRLRVPVRGDDGSYWLDRPGVYDMKCVGPVRWHLWRLLRGGSR